MALPSGDTKGWGATVLTVTTTPVQLSLDPHTRVQIIKNANATAVTVYLGGSDLTSANTATDGYPLAQNENIKIDQSQAGAVQTKLYAVTASGSVTMAILRGDV